MCVRYLFCNSRNRYFIGTITLFDIHEYIKYNQLRTDTQNLYHVVLKVALRIIAISNNIMADGKKSSFSNQDMVQFIDEEDDARMGLSAW